MEQLNLKATLNQDGSITASWSPITGAVRYHAYMGPVGASYVIYNEKDITGTSYTSQSNLTANQQYKITLVAYGASGSLTSDGITILIPSDFYNHTPLKAPENVRASAQMTSVTVSFDAVSRAESYDILFDNTVYNVTATSRQFTGLKENTSYTYAVRARNSESTSPYSTTKSITTKKKTLSVPTGITKVATETSVTINWNAVSGATGYEIVFNGTTYSVNSTGKVVLGLTAGTEYSFMIRATDGSLYSAYTSAITAVTPPKAPKNISAVSTETEVTVTWEAVSRASGYIIKFNNIEYAVASSVTSKTFTDLARNTSYSYKICSKSVDGTGAYGGTKTIKTLARGVTVPAGITHRSTNNSVTISWSAVSGATGYDVWFNGSAYSVTGTSREFTGLSANTAYSYQVRSKTFTATGSYSAVQTARTAPNAPSSTTVNTNENSVTISWSEVSGATDYDLLFNDKVYNVLGTSCKISALEANTSYNYQIRTNNADGSSSYSASKTIKTTPKPPASPSVTAAQDSVTVSWSGVTGATSYDVLFDGKTYRTTGTSYTITGLTAGTSYTYAVRANNADGSSSYCESKTVSTIPYEPSVPSGISASSSWDCVIISWNAVPGAESYDVLLGGNTYHETVNTITIIRLNADTEYTYQVRSNNAKGSSAYSAPMKIRTLVKPPAVPENVTASASSYYVTVKWGAVANAESYDVLLDDTVYHTTDTSRKITGLSPDTLYTYRVRARNAGGPGGYSVALKIRTLDKPPAVPSNVNAVADKDSVTVTWDAVDGAAGYVVKFDNKYYSVKDTSKTFTGLTSGTEYSYAVNARSAGGGASEYSAEQTIRTQPDIPGVPENIRIEAADRYVNISWDQVTGADSYEVILGGETYTYTSCKCRIWGLEANTEYPYQIRAVNEAGAGEYSAVKKFRTRLKVPENVRAQAAARSVTISFEPVDGATRYVVLFNGEQFTINETYKTFEGLEPETKYTYMVCAKNAYVESVYTAAGSISTLRPGPAMPSDVMAVAAFNSVIISWSQVPDAEDYDILFDEEAYHVTENGEVSLADSGAPFQMVRGMTLDAAGCRPSSAFQIHGLEQGAEASCVLQEAGTPALISEADHAAGTTRIYRMFDGLAPDSTHSYSVRANNREGSSPYTETEYVTTEIRKSSGLAQAGHRRTYPDGRKSYMGIDPVNALTGAFLWSRTWLEDYGKDGLHFTAMYDSRRDERQGVLGAKWTHSLNYMLYREGEHVYFSTPYDDVVSFTRNMEDGSYQPTDGTAAFYTMTRNDNGTYSVTALDETEYVFDSGMCLNRILENGLVTYKFATDAQGQQIVRMEGRHGAYMDLDYEEGRIIRVTDAMGNKAVFTYKNGRLTSVTDPDGREMLFTYDTAGNLLTISDLSGEVYLTNTYDMQGRVTGQLVAGRGASLVSYDEENRRTCFTDELGNTTTYTYDGSGRVTSVSLDGKTLSTVYDEQGRMTQQKDALGNTTRMEYDEKGRMNRVIHPDGTQESAVYNDRNQPVKTVARDGSETLYRYDERGNLTAVQDERGNTSTYTYDENDNLTSYTDRNGNVWTYTYDERNHLEQAADPEGNTSRYTHDAIGRMTSYTSPGGKTAVYQYSAAGDLLSVTDAEGEILFEYDEKGNRTGTTDKMGSQKRLEYNDTGKVSLAADCLGKEYRFAYDERGNLITETDPLGYSISHTYDASGNRTSLTDKNGNTTRYSFDAGNRLIQVKDAAGGIISYTYDCMGQVTAVTDQLSGKRIYTYDSAGRILSETDPLGHSISCTYDEAGNLLTRTDEDGNTVSYTYDAENRLESIRTDAGTTSFAYDSLGRILSVTDTEGCTERAEYDADDRLTASSDREGRQTRCTYDHLGRLREEILPDGGKTSYAYDKNGNCIRITDAQGHVYSCEYDAENRPVKVTDPSGGETAYAYDGRGQLIKTTDAKGGVTEYTYDGNGNLTGETNPLGGTRTYVYDSLNRLTVAADEEGNTRTWTYDAAGNCISHTDANGNTRTCEYDACGRMTGIRNGNGECLELEYTGTGRISRVTDMEGAATDYEYDTLGRLTKISDALGHSTSFTYDSLGRVLTRTDANGNTTEYTYSPAGNLLTATDPEGNTTAYTYDARGQVLTKEDALGNKVSYAYDLLGQVVSMTDALGNTTAFTYTAQGRIAAVENAEGGITRYTYDACGNLTRTEDPLGNVTEYGYDAMNNRIRECLSGTDEQSCITLYQYDKKGRMIREIDPMLEEKTYAYDGNDNLVSVTDEEKRETVITYDLNNSPAAMTLSDGRRTVLRYNKRGELVEMQDWNGTTSMERDILGRLTGVTDHNGRKTGFTYDPAGNRTGIRYPDGSAAAFAYDKNGHLLKVTGIPAPAGMTTGALTDAAAETPGVMSMGAPMGTVTGLPAGTAGETSGEAPAVPGEILAQYTYDPAGNVISLIQPGSTASYTYNANRQPVKAAYCFGGAGTASAGIPVGGLMETMAGIPMKTAAQTSAEIPGDSSVYDFMEESFTYDVLGRLTGSQRTGSRPEYARTAAYAYDPVGQLVSYQNGQTVEAYTYDALGNRTSRSLNGIQKTAYRYNALNQLISLSENGTDYSFGYDKCGSLTEERRGGELMRQYTYDPAGRMTLGKNLESGEETAYTYNALQMCVKNVQKLKTADGFRTREMQYVPDFLSSTNNELMAYETGNGSIRTVFGPGYQRLCQVRTAGDTSDKTFFQSDIYGSPIFAADGQGTLKQYAERDIWGDLKTGAKALPGLEENLRFTSYRYDPVIGKHFAQARFYDSENGRMLAEDPVKRGLNRYRYCDNDPVDYVDPTGEVANILGGAVLGGIFGGAGGFISSAVSQKLSGQKFDAGKAWGAAANGAITGAVQGALIGSGAGIPLAFAANFAAGTAGSAAEQYISEGKVSAGKSITNGLTTAVSNAIYGTKPLGSFKEAFLKGAGAGAAVSGINYLSDTAGWQNVMKRAGEGSIPELPAVMTASTLYDRYRDPRRGCGSTSPFERSLGYSSAKGYQYSTPQPERGSGQGGCSLLGFLKATTIGAVTGGLSSAAFYGAGKGIENLKRGLQFKRSGSKPLSLKIGDDATVNRAMEIAGPSTNEVFKVVGHGNPKGIEFKGRLLNAKEIAILIKSSPQYVGGKQIVKLYSCETGKIPNGFAQQLANELGVVVEAPNKLIYPTKLNDFAIADKLYKPGDWIPFEPQK